MAMNYLAGPDTLDFSFDPGAVMGVPADVTPAGSDTQLPPTQPASVNDGPQAAAGAIAAAQHTGAMLTAQPFYKQPAFQAFAIAAVGVVFIGHAAFVASKT